MNETFLFVIVVTGLVMLVWDCVEVGRNDAANLVNAVFGARVLARNTAVLIAGVAVILGATFASPVMETAHKGIFNPALLTIEAAMVVYITAYIVDTVLLHTYSALGMPVSTTASQVFELVGASAAVAWLSGISEQIVHWDKVGTVVSAIVVSIVISGIAGWMMQRMFRGAIAMAAAGLVAGVIFKLQYLGLALGLGTNFLIRYLVSKSSARHEVAFHQNIPKA